MLIINNHIIHSFDADRAFYNTYKDYDYEKFSNLLNALNHSCINRNKENFNFGDKIKTVTEYYKFPKNLMIIGDEKEQQYYQIIKDSKIGNCLTDYTYKEIVEFFKLSEFCVLDNYGKRLNIATFDELESFIKNIKDCRSTVRDKNNIRKKYSEKLEEFRKRRTLMPNEQLGEDFNQIVNISNSYYEEINDILTSIMFNTHADIIKKYIKQPDNNISNNIVFGLYIAVLKSFIEHKNIEIEDFNSVDYIVYLAFLKEFNNFYGENIDILEKYSKYFDLRKAEEDSIIILLKKHKINGEEWLYCASDLES